MPFPISFSSFGDIVTAVDIALRISKALSSSSGSSYEYQYLIQELDALAHVLQLADTATRTGVLQGEVVRALVAEIGRCREVMDGLWGRIRGYQKALGATDSSGKIRTAKGGGSSWRKIGWALFKTQDVHETRAKLATHRANLTTLMTACNMYGAVVSSVYRADGGHVARSNMDELKTQCVRFEKTIHTRLSELYYAISQLPHRIGYTNANSITIVDWCGIETILPLHLVDYGLEQMHAVLGVLSFQWPEYLRSLINERRYHLVCNDTKTLLWTEESLAGSLRPGNSLRVVSVGLMLSGCRVVSVGTMRLSVTNSRNLGSDPATHYWYHCKRCWNHTRCVRHVVLPLSERCHSMLFAGCLFAWSVYAVQIHLSASSRNFRYYQVTLQFMSLDHHPKRRLSRSRPKVSIARARVLHWNTY